MRDIRVWAAVLGLSLGRAGVARAQPQDDAALADDDKKWEHEGDPAWSGFQPQPRRATAKREPEPEPGPALTTAQLRQAYPDLQLRATPTTVLAFFPAAIYPFQAIAVGASVDIYVLPRLRLSSFLTIGASPAVTNGWSFSLYGELGIGVPVLRWLNETTVDLPVVANRFHREGPTDAPSVRATVPTSHSVELEVGAFNGRYQLYDCTANCSDPDFVGGTYKDASLQVFIAYAGVRYVYYRWARSAQAPFRSSQRFQVAVDVLTNPFKAPDAALYNLYHHHPAHNPVGARLTFRLPGVKCANLAPCFGLSVSGGYLPTPSDALFSINIDVY